MSAGPEPPTLNVAGLRLPWRETVVVLVTTFVLLIEYYHGTTLLEGVASQALMRVALYVVVPLVVLLLLDERPSAYGLRIGAWRIGLLVAGAFALVATPIILVAAGLPDFQAYYHLEAADLRVALFANAVDVAAAEFLFRGFLMWTLVRLAGPMGVVLATFPFVFTHLGKPELETLSTFFGGMGFGWLAWRTQSVLYGALLHVYLISLIVLATSG